ncbi:MAG: hypothetical protein JXA43_00905 [Candidatus Diapherotrites archaeon]|nr:hypothetical protein [Candidatus Diapherotrites archaeon]
MLGYVLCNNDIFAYLERLEIDVDLERSPVKGLVFDRNRVGDLVLSVENIYEKIDADIVRDDSGIITNLHLKINPREFERLKERRDIGSHDGFRHISISDIAKLNTFDLSNLLFLFDKK